MRNRDSIAVIPARGGSKRIPNKNRRLILGKPSISYSIELAHESNLFSEVIVSTDDEEIARIAKKSGASVPFVRSASLSDDHTSTMEVIKDAIHRLNLKKFPFLCCIYPVTPLLRKHDLQKAHQILTLGQWDYVLAACKYSVAIERAFRRHSSGKIEFIDKKYIDFRTQDLQTSFHDAGQFYFGRMEAWRLRKSILGGNSTFIEFSRDHIIDVDNPEDWTVMEEILSHQIKKK